MRISQNYPEIQLAMKNLKIEIKWGIIFMLSTLIWMLIEKSLGWHDEKIADHALYTNIFAMVAISVYVFAILDKKRNFYKSQMSYKQGFIAGVILTFFIVLLSPLSQYVTSVWITPDYFPNVIDYTVESGEMSQADAEAYFNLENYLLQATVGSAVMGLITSAVVAFFLKSKL
jgi:hypothetical protein